MSTPLESNTTKIQSILETVNSLPPGGTQLPTLANPAGAAQILNGYEAIDGAGAKLTGTIPSKGAGDLTASGATVTVPAGYYPSQASKSMKDVTSSKNLSISVNNTTGMITAVAMQQDAGYVEKHSTYVTKQLSTKGAETITPGTSNKTIGAPVYLTGTQTIKGDANLVPENIKSGVSIFGVAGTAETPTYTIEYVRIPANSINYNDGFTWPLSNPKRNTVKIFGGHPGGSYATILLGDVLYQCESRSGSLSYNKNAKPISSYITRTDSGLTIAPYFAVSSSQDLILAVVDMD